MNWSIEKKLAGAFVLALVILATVSGLAYRSAREFITESRRVAQTHEVMTALETLLLLVNEEEAATRRHAVSGLEEDAVLARATAARAGGQFQRVQFLTADNPEQQRRLTELKRDFDANSRWVEAVLQARTAADPEDARPLLVANEPRRALERIGLIIGRMKNAEQLLLARREVATTAGGQTTLTALMSIAVFALVALGVAMHFIRRDLTERRRAADRIQAYADELERSNRELENFASVASHDLQEPLRKVRAFGDRLQQRCGPALPPEGREYLERMQSAAERMQTLITDLLTYSRVSTAPRVFAPVDLAGVLAEVLSDLEVRIDSVSGRVEVGELPVLEADAAQVRQLFQNLLGNALKFHRPGTPPLIQIRAEAVAGDTKGLADAPRASKLWRISITDNGIGFDEKYLDRIFTIFQRLHGRDAYEGTGVGLAVCQKIVQRHSGTITARSQPGQGATFLVTLPALQPRLRQ